MQEKWLINARDERNQGKRREELKHETKGIKTREERNWSVKKRGIRAREECNQSKIRVEWRQGKKEIKANKERN